MSFLKKIDAVKQYETLQKNNRTKGADRNVYLFQEDVNSTGRKQFLVKKIKEIFDKTNDKSNDSHFYEFWLRHTPIKFSLDIDLPKKGLTYEDSQEILKKNVEEVIYHAEQYYDHVYDISDIIILETIPQESSDKKFSYHVIFDGLIFANHLVCKDFFKRMKKESALKGCDESIYNLGCLRIMGSSKMGEKRVLKPIQYRINGIQTKIGNDQAFFERTLITYTANINENKFVSEDEIIAEYETLIDPKEIDAEIKIGKENIENIDIEKILNELPSETCDDYPQWIRIGMILANTTKKSGVDLFDLFNKWSSKSKKYKGIDDVKKHWKQLISKTGGKLSIASLIFEAKKNNIGDIFKNGKKSAETIVNEYPKKQIILTKKKNTISLNQRYLTPELFTKYSKYRLLAVQSEKGTGKTSNLIESYFKNGLIKDDMNILFISSRRTFGAKLFGDMSKYGFKLYSDFEEQYITHNRIICQIDSLLRLDLDKYHLIIVDECESLARYMTSQHFTKNNKATMIINRYETYLNSASNVYILDADLSDRCVNFYENVMNVTENDMALIVNNFELYNDYLVNYMRFNDWLNQIVNEIEKNKKIVIAMASNSKGKDLRDILAEKFPTKRLLFLNRDVSDAEKINIVSNVDEQWSRYDVVIYTPSVCMGVSYDKINHFDAIYAYGCEGSLGAQEFCQMIHRVRHPKNKVIYLTFDRYEEFNEENKISYEQAEGLICNDHYLTHYDIHTNIVPHKLKRVDDYLKFINGGTAGIVEEKTTKPTQIHSDESITSHRNNIVTFYPYKDQPEYDLYVRNCMETIENKNNFCWSVFGYMKHKNYKLKYLKVDDAIEYSKLLREKKKERVEREKEDYLERIVDTPDIDENEYYEIQRKREELRTDEEIMKIKRFQFKKCFDIENICEDKEKTKKLFEQYDDPQKKKHYRNLKRILETPEQKTDDKLNMIKINIINDPYRKNAYSDLITRNIYTSHKYVLEMLSNLDLDINNLSKTISEEDFENGVLSIQAEFDDKYNDICYKFNCKYQNKNFTELDQKEAVTFVKKIIKSQYGLDIKKESNVYKLCVPVDGVDSMWNKLFEYKKNKVVEGESLNNLIEPINVGDKMEEEGFIND
jgi:hypothetical protein